MENNTLELKRLSWRCRRGMLEMDIVLGRFVAQGYSQLNAEEQQLFDVLLDLPDTILWDKVAGLAAADTPEQEALLRKLRLA